jgi:hypothetical protein
MRRPYIFLLFIMLVSYGTAKSQTVFPGKESAVAFTVTNFDKKHTYGSDRPTDEYRVLGGVGLIYGHYISNIFSLESHFEAEGGNHFFNVTISGNLVYNYNSGTDRPIYFVEGGLGLSAPGIFATEWRSVDIITLTAGTGVKIPVTDVNLLRVELCYRQFKVYNSSTATDFYTNALLGVRIAWTFVSK